KAVAMAWPRPRAPPITTATWPVSSRFIVGSWALGERIHLASWDLHFGRLQHELIRPFRRSGELQFLDAPADVVDLPAERWLTRDVADDANRRRIETLWHSRGVALGAAQDGLDHRVFLQGCLRLLVNLAHGLADLGVAESLHVFHEEVHEPGFG